MTGGGLPAASLRRRVVVTSVLVLAAVIVLVAVAADVLFAVQTRTEVAATLNARAAQAGQLVAAGVAPAEVVRRVRLGGGVDVVLRSAGGQVLATAGDVRTDGTRAVVRRLPDGSTITLAPDPSVLGAPQRRLQRVLVLVGAAGILVAAGALLVGTRFALAPLDAMTSLARSITAGGRGRRLAPRRRDTELGRAATAFDEMLDALESAEARAHASERSTRRFLADAAHELRTPLAGIAAVAEAVTSPGLGVAEREQYSTLLVRDARRAGRLVEGLLTLARLDAGVELDVAEVDLAELARAEVDRVRLLHDDRDVALDAVPTPVRVDADLVGQAVSNLVTNAVRHGAGRITVTVGRSGPTARLAVADEGPGVLAADRERVFERMLRLDDGRAAGVRAGGAGLGLAIARQAARAHGGDLVCADPGTVFVLTVPAADGLTSGA